VESWVLNRSVGRMSLPPWIARLAIELNAPFASSMLALIRFLEWTVDDDDAVCCDDGGAATGCRAIGESCEGNRYDEAGLMRPAAMPKMSDCCEREKTSRVERRVCRLGVLSDGKRTELAAGLADE